MIAFILSYFAGRGLDQLLKHKPNIKGDITQIYSDLATTLTQKINRADHPELYHFSASEKVENTAVIFLFEPNYSSDELYAELLGDTRITPFERAELDGFLEEIRNKASENSDIREVLSWVKLIEIQRKQEAMPDEVVARLTNANDIRAGEIIRSQITQYKELINNLQLKTATQLLTGFETHIDSSNTESLAIIAYLKGICAEYIKSVDPYPLYLKAFKLDPKSLEIRQKAIVSYIKSDDITNGIKIADLIISENDDYDPYAWFAKAYITTDLDEYLCGLPQRVKTDIQYKRLMYDIFYTDKRIGFNSLMDADIIADDIEIIDDLNFTNLKLWLYKANLLFNKHLHTQEFRLFKIFDSHNSQVKSLHDACEKIYTLINDSEISESFDSLKFLYFYTKYEMTDDVSCVKELDKLESTHTQSIFGYLYANTKQLEEDYSKALETLNAVADDGNDFIETDVQIRFTIGIKTNNEDLVFQSLQRLIENSSIISDFHLRLILMGADTPATVEKLHPLLEDKRFESQWNKKLWTAFSENILQQSSIDERNLLEISNNINNELKLFVAIICYRTRQYQLGIEILDTYIDKDKPSSELACYINLLDKGNQRTEELLEILKGIREKYSSHMHEHLVLELNLRNKCRDYKESVKILEILYSLNPDSEDIISRYIHVLSLVAKNRDKLDAFKSRLSGGFTFKNQDNCDLVVDSFLRLKEFDLALELAYNCAKSENNTKARMRYMHMSTLPAIVPLIKEFEVVVDETYVNYFVDGVSDTVYVDQNALTKITKPLLGKRIGNDIEISYEFDKKSVVHIEKIYNKYRHLLSEIYNSISKPIHSLSVTQIKFPDSVDGASIVEVFQREFGKAGDERSKAIEERFEAYRSGQMSFFELCVHIADGDYIKMYHTITADAGFRITPKQLFYHNDMLPSKDAQFALDFSSLLLIFELCQKCNLIISDKFIVSQLLVDRIDSYYYEESLSAESPGFLNITSAGVQLIRNTEGYKASLISYYSNLRQWVKKHCEVVMVSEKLDLIKDENTSPDFELLLENFLISQRDNIWLISDDRCYNTIFRDYAKKVITTELYIDVKSLNSNEIQSFQLSKNYHGITVSEEIMYNEFNKKLRGEEHLFEKCLLNLEYNPSMFSNIVDFSFKVSENRDLSNSDIEHDIVNIFVSLIKNIDIKLYGYIRNLILIRLYPLPSKQQFFIKCFDKACDIISPLS